MNIDTILIIISSAAIILKKIEPKNYRYKRENMFENYLVLWE